MAEKKILCMPCWKALGSVNYQAESIFLKLKDRGSLFKPTQSVITICEETEKCFEPLLQLCYLVLYITTNRGQMMAKLVQLD